MKIVMYKVKKGKLDQWRNWCNRLGNELREEAINTLLEEKVQEEGCYLFTVEGIDFVVFFSIGDESLSVNMQKEINLEHKRMKEECLDKIQSGKGEKLYHLLSNVK